jgi:hypothetical protein
MQEARLFWPVTALILFFQFKFFGPLLVLGFAPRRTSFRIGLRLGQRVSRRRKRTADCTDNRLCGSRVLLRA